MHLRGWDVYADSGTHWAVHVIEPLCDLLGHIEDRYSFRETGVRRKRSYYYNNSTFGLLVMISMD
jgi:hypothetical protein